MTYRVKDWGKHFENSESRKYTKLRWVPIPNTHDGKKYRRLISMAKGAEIFGAWILILEVASRANERGLLADDDGPITAMDMFFKTGMSDKIFENAFKVLSSKEIGWLEDVSPGFIPEDSEKSRISPADSEKSSLNRIELNRTELNRTEEDVGANGSPPASDFESVISEFSLMPAYEGIDVRQEFHKMSAWCSINRKSPGRRRFVNWLNRADRPINGTGHAKTPAQIRRDQQAAREFPENFDIKIL